MKRLRPARVRRALLVWLDRIAGGPAGTPAYSTTPAPVARRR